MSSKSKRNKPGKDRPSNWHGRNRSGLLTPVSRRALAANLNLIMGNHEQFRGPAMVNLLPALKRLLRLSGGVDVDMLHDDDVIALWDLVYDVTRQNRDTYNKLTAPGSHDDCALDLQNGLNAFGGPPEEMAWQMPILNRGGTILMPCPACAEDGNPHVLAVHKVGDEFVVEAADD